MQYLTELDGLRSHLAATQATADASAASAQSAQLQCLALVKEIDQKNCSLKEQDERITRLGEQLDKLHKDLQARESSQKQLKDDVLRIEHDIMQAVAQAGLNRDCELRKILDEVSPKNIEKLNKLLVVKDEEIGKLKDEIRIMSAHWNLKTKELESQVIASVLTIMYYILCLVLFSNKVFCQYFFLMSINLFVGTVGETTTS